MPAYEELESEVIEEGLCTYCGACVSACPLFYLKWIDGKPKRPEKKAACEDCEVCYHACYRTVFDKEAIEEEIISAAGTKYGVSPNLLKVRTAVIDDMLDNICIVGLPCHVKAVRHLQHIKFDLAPAIKFVIGLFCHGNFEYERMIAGITVNMGEVEKISVSKGVFQVRTRDTKLSIPLKETGGWLSGYCQTCDDYSAELADISVGSEGSKEGWSSVILRTKKGEEVFSELETKNYLKTKEIDNLESIKKNSVRKKLKRF